MSRQKILFVFSSYRSIDGRTERMFYVNVDGTTQIWRDNDVDLASHIVRTKWTDKRRWFNISFYHVTSTFHFATCIRRIFFVSINHLHNLHRINVTYFTFHIRFWIIRWINVVYLSKKSRPNFTRNQHYINVSYLAYIWRVRMIRIYDVAHLLHLVRPNFTPNQHYMNVAYLAYIWRVRMVRIYDVALLLH